MICVLCRQAEIIDGLTSVNFETSEMHLVINNVPARVCSSCREAYVEQDIASQLLRVAREMTEAGVFEAHCEYSNV
jgi:YgiT-type zinc finger domain-containing protein